MPRAHQKSRGFRTTILGFLLIAWVGLGIQVHFAYSRWSEVQALLQQMRQRRDTRLTLYDTSGTDDMLRYLAGTADIEDLTLDLTDVSDDGIKLVATLPNLRRLEVYGGRSSMSDLGLTYLQGKARLQVLELKNTLVTDAGLASLPELPDLRHLTIDCVSWPGRKLSDRGLKQLERLTNLETLKVGGGWASKSALADLRKKLANCEVQEHPF